MKRFLKNAVSPLVLTCVDKVDLGYGVDIFLAFGLGVLCFLMIYFTAYVLFHVIILDDIMSDVPGI